MLLLWEFFPPALADGFSPESEGQQVSSDLQDSSQYTSRCDSLDYLWLPVPRVFYPAFEDRTGSSKSIGVIGTLSLNSFFEFSGKVYVFDYLSFIFHAVVQRNGKT